MKVVIAGGELALGLLALGAWGCGSDSAGGGASTHASSSSSSSGAGGGAAACDAGEAPSKDGSCVPAGLGTCTDRDASGACTVSTESCPGAQIPNLQGSPACFAVGVEKCAHTFVGDDGHCHASSSKCAEDEIPVPTAGCTKIDACGSGTWGNIPEDAGNVYVDASYAGGDGVGSKTKPFATLADALAAVGAGKRVALAAGTYDEAANLDKSVTLEGRCASMVTLTGVDVIGRMVVLGAPDVTVRGLTVAGHGVGVTLEKSAHGHLDHVAIRGARGYAINANDGGDLDVDTCIVADTKRDAFSPGEGLIARGGAHVTVQHSAFLRNRKASLEARDAKTTLDVTDTLVEGTIANLAFYNGDGIGVFHGATATLTNVVSWANESAGLRTAGAGATARVDRCTLEGDPNAGTFGSLYGLFVDDGSEATVSGSAILANYFAGLDCQGTVTVDTTLFRDGGALLFADAVGDFTDDTFVHSPSSALRVAGLKHMRVTGTRLVIEDTVTLEKEFGIGIAVDGASKVKLQDIWIDKALVAGILFSGADVEATVDRVTIRRVHDGKFQSSVTGKPETTADGVAVSNKATATLTAISVSDCDRAGFFFDDAKGDLSTSVATKNQLGVVTEGKSKPTLDTASNAVQGNSQNLLSDGDLVAPEAPAAL